jgi:hypothetical protein
MSIVQMVVTGVFEVIVPDGLTGEDLEQAAEDSFAEEIPCQEVKQIYSITKLSEV